MKSDDPLPEGLYESLLTARLQKLLDQHPEEHQLLHNIAEGDEPHVLARHVRSAVERALADERDP